MKLIRDVKHFFETLCVTFFIFSSLTSLAQPDQCLLAPDQFTGSLMITPGIGCVPLTIKAYSGLKDVKNVRYVYDYKGGAVKESELTRDSVFTYHKPGLYRVLQYSEQEDRQLRACAMVQVYDTISPELVLVACLKNVTLTIPKAPDYHYDWYTVDWGDGNQERLDGLEPLGKHAYSDTFGQRLIQVKGVHLYGNCGGTTRILFRPATNTSTPVIDNLQSVSNAIELTISNPGGNRFRIEQRLPNGSYFPTAYYSDSETARIRVDADTTTSFCFRLALADTCMQMPPSAEVCYTPQKPHSPASDSVMSMPDAFSPNADGINDRFYPHGLSGGTFRMTVYNRWGEVIFMTDDPGTGWDGRQNDQASPPGTYSYHVDIKKTDGKRLQKWGKVLLVK